MEFVVNRDLPVQLALSETPVVEVPVETSASLAGEVSRGRTACPAILELRATLDGRELKDSLD